MLLYKKLDEYREKFKEGFPMYELGRTRPREEVIRMIDQCLETGKDPYELGFLSREDLERFVEY